MFRQVINDGMDIVGGGGIIRGKKNLLANAYFSAPISITVEGANIMTRSLIHFGQGAVMCHPFVYKEIEALQNNNVADFDKALFGHISHFLSNKIRSLLLGLSRGRFYKSKSKGITAKYEKKLAWASSSFAFLADIAIIKFGGNLKRKEKIGGRFGDILSAMYIAICVLKKFDVDGRKIEDEFLVEYVMKDLFSKMQVAFDGLWQNMFSNFTKILLFPVIFFARINKFSSSPDDNIEHKIASNALKSGEFRNHLTSGIYIPKDQDQSLAKLESALLLFEKSELILSRIKKAIKENLLPKENPEQLIDLAIEKNIIDKKDREIITQAAEAINDVIQVDEYSLEEYLSKSS